MTSPEFICLHTLTCFSSCDLCLSKEAWQLVSIFLALARGSSSTTGPANAEEAAAADPFEASLDPGSLGPLALG